MERCIFDYGLPLSHPKASSSAVGRPTAAATQQALKLLDVVTSLPASSFSVLHWPNGLLFWDPWNLQILGTSPHTAQGGVRSTLCIENRIFEISQNQPI